MAAAVVRHHDAFDAAIDAAPRIVAAQHALDHDRHGGALHQPFEVVKVGREHRQALAVRVVGGLGDRLADMLTLRTFFDGETGVRAARGLQPGTG